MAITFFSLDTLFTPLHALLEWMAGPPPVPAVVHVRTAAMRAARPRMALQRPPAKPLRVVRVVDPTVSRAVAGRMVISGRLADVCAELDRLAAQESRLH